MNIALADDFTKNLYKSLTIYREENVYICVQNNRFSFSDDASRSFQARKDRASVILNYSNN